MTDALTSSHCACVTGGPSPAEPPPSACVLSAPLPAHSHVVDQAEGNFWELHVIGVKDPATWDQVVAGKSLAAVRALQAADPTGTKITPEILTNVYLFFDVRPGAPVAGM